MGLILFVTSLRPPRLIDICIGYTASAFTPMSMIIIGGGLAAIKLSDIKLPKALWGGMLVRNFVFSILCSVIFAAMGLTGVPLYTTIILSACPVAGLIVLFAMMAGWDAKPAIIFMSVSLLLSIVSIPFVYWVTSFL